MTAVSVHQKNRKRPFTILFTCVGRRVSLIKAFHAAAKGLKLPLVTIGADVSPLSPGLYVCDKQVVGIPVNAPGYRDHLSCVIKKHKIDLIIPTIDTELLFLSKNKSYFESYGAKVLVSENSVVGICQDKRKTYEFLRRNGFDTPKTFVADDVSGKNLPYPVFLKPWDGSASKGNAIVRNQAEFRQMVEKIPNCLVQEYITGQEVTCDVYVDFTGKVRTVVPRKRIEVRAGEVSKSQTFRHEQVIRECWRLVELLKAGPGVITIQCFLTQEHRVKIIEINPRFGGGVPLSIQAGANFPKWIVSELAGKSVRINQDGWDDGLYMLRYDEAIWISDNDMVK
jgi:carbamoyl-phosphate synthase large subunit